MFAKEASKTACYFDKQLIAGQVAEEIVDLLEPIKIEIK